MVFLQPGALGLHILIPAAGPQACCLQSAPSLCSSQQSTARHACLPVGVRQSHRACLSCLLADLQVQDHGTGVSPPAWPGIFPGAAREFDSVSIICPIAIAGANLLRKCLQQTRPMLLRICLSSAMWREKAQHAGMLCSALPSQIRLMTAICVEHQRRKEKGRRLIMGDSCS